ncbi:D-hexose-6-phosphate mutarotase [Bifidobacterium miconisargentati]|uniref:D-hexose-6-phosphate mutarotase n=1 Tax=Bifidobacterium miconisargentati TaxID=2834437 RepID=UPI001BDD075C|nr:D-hexose-6-phosphate mutarotase [Bifidobacterium miconisargentati]MBW3090694.1 D-hexose-6-phosphate mutarotase [Bifidobacterium miconisargentati]
MSTSFTVRSLADEGGSATVSDHGAHVLRWAPQGQPDVVWQPRAITFREDAAIRGGVPVIFPWFNQGYEDGHMADKKPKHGFARVSAWQVDADSLSADHIRYTLDSSAIDAATLAQFVGNPNPRFHAAYEVTAGETLKMALTVTNTGDEPFSYEAALHTYFHVGDVTRSQVIGLDGARYLDATQPGFPECGQAGPVAFDGSMVDRIYLANGPLEVHDEALDRTIAIEAEGSTATVVWNPGETAGNAIGDLATGEWREFVCVEAAANRERMITLEAGQSHTLAQSVAVR